MFELLLGAAIGYGVALAYFNFHNNYLWKLEKKIDFLILQIHRNTIRYQD